MRTRADLVTLGAFRLSPVLIEKIGNFEPAFLAEGEAMPEALEGKAQIDGDRFYLGDNPASPQVGDVRISFKVAKPTDVSVIAVQREQSFVPYQAEAGGTIQLLQTGVLSRHVNATSLIVPGVKKLGRMPPVGTRSQPRP